MAVSYVVLCVGMILHLPSTYECDFYMTVTSIWMWLLYDCDFYMNVTSIWMWLLYECDFYMNGISIWMWLPYECDFFTNVASIWIRLQPSRVWMRLYLFDTIFITETLTKIKSRLDWSHDAGQEWTENCSTSETEYQTNLSHQYI